MNQAFRAFAGAMLVLSAAFFALGVGQRVVDARALDSERAFALARGLAWVSVQEHLREDDQAEGLTQRTLVALQKEAPAMREALVLKGTEIAAHTKPERAGTRLDRDSLTDKDLYDAFQRLKATLKKNVEEREKHPGDVRSAYPEEEALRADATVTVNVPARLEDSMHALAVVTVARGGADGASLPLPWLVLALGAAAVALFFALSRTKAAVVLGAVLAVAVAAADAFALVAWHADVNDKLVEGRAQAYAALVRAGVVAAAAPDEKPTLVPLLAEDSHRVARNDVVLVDAAGAPAPAGARAIAVDGASVAFSEASFAAASAKDRADVALWALMLGVLAVAAFVLGARGLLARFAHAVVEHKNALVYLSPAMVGLLVLVFIPVVFGIALGFMTRQYNVFHFAGLSNYVAILSDFRITEPSTFYFKFLVTVLWTVTNVSLHVVIGLILALMLNDQMLKARGVYRVLLIVPWAIPNYITALIWKGLFHKQFGAINAFLEVLGLEPIAWFQSFWPAFFTNLATNTWLGFPFMMVISLGALQSIPADLYEAARVDGASRWQRFWKITLPLLMPALVPAVITGTVWTFNMFNIIYLVSGGAPDGATDILITDAFRWAFERDNYGYAAAYSTLIFLILLAFTAVTNRITGATKGAFE